MQKFLEGLNRERLRSSFSRDKREKTFRVHPAKDVSDYLGEKVTVSMESKIKGTK